MLYSSTPCKDPHARSQRLHVSHQHGRCSATETTRIDERYLGLGVIGPASPASANSDRLLNAKYTNILHAHMQHSKHKRLVTEGFHLMLPHKAAVRPYRMFWLLFLQWNVRCTKDSYRGSRMDLYLARALSNLPGTPIIASPSALMT